MRTAQQLAEAYARAKLPKIHTESIQLDLDAVEGFLVSQALDVLEFAMPLAEHDFIMDLEEAKRG